MRRLPILSVLLACLASAAAGQQQAAPVKNVRITVDPPADGKQIVSIHATPTATFTADRLEAVCQYRQEYDFPPRATNPVRRVVEPAVFTYVARQVKFVDSLEIHLHFFVPVDIKVLREKHGPTTFATNAPATLSSVAVSAMLEGRPVWTFQAAPVTNTADGVLK